MLKLISIMLNLAPPVYLEGVERFRCFSVGYKNFPNSCANSSPRVRRPLITEITCMLALTQSLLSEARKISCIKIYRAPLRLILILQIKRSPLLKGDLYSSSALATIGSTPAWVHSSKLSPSE